MNLLLKKNLTKMDSCGTEGQKSVFAGCVANEDKHTTMKILNNLKQKAKALKNEIIALSLSLKHKKTPWQAKMMIGLTISYALSPIDLIPDFIPVIGHLDDLIILPFMILISIKMIPAEVMEECRKRAVEGIRLNKKIGLYTAVVIILLWTVIIGWFVSKILQ